MHKPRGSGPELFRGGPCDNQQELMERNEIEVATEPPLVASPQRLRWGAAVLAGLIVGCWFLLLPRGIPWTSVTFFSAAVIGRVMPPDVPFLSATVLHFALSILYGLVIAVVVRRLRAELAILIGALAGLGLYLLNLAAVYFLFHWAYGSEPAVAITHILFGAFAAGAYRGLAGRRSVHDTDVAV